MRRAVVRLLSVPMLVVGFLAAPWQPAPSPLAAGVLLMLGGYMLANPRGFLFLFGLDRHAR